MFTVHQIPSERKCQRLLHKFVFGTESCPFCNSTMQYTPSYAWCSCCRKKVRAKAASWLRHSRLAHRQIVVLVFCWQQKVNPGSIRMLTGLSYPTIERWYRIFRDHLPDTKVLLKDAVEVDESYFGKQKFGHQTIVVGAREHSGKTVLRVIPDRDSLTLTPFLLEVVEKASLILTDCHAGYEDLEWYGYGHQRCNHSRGDFGSTARIENCWSTAKRHLKRMYCRFIHAYLPGLLKEWQARANQPELFTNPFTYLKTTLVPLPLT